jgi:hypothetical protein
MVEMCFYYWVHGRIRPSFFYNLPQGELTAIRTFYELEIKEIQDTQKLT